MSGERKTASEYPKLTISQVADRLSISEATLFRFLARGEGPPSYCIGKRRLFRESDVLEWLENECREDGSGGAEIPSRAVELAAALRAAVEAAAGYKSMALSGERPDCGCSSCKEQAANLAFARAALSNFDHEAGS